MLKRTICEIDGKQYMIPKVAGDKWNMKYQTVTQACKDGRIVGAAHDSNNHWLIPIDAKPPLEEETIRKALIALLGLKNRPDILFEAPNSMEIGELLRYLSGLGYIEGTSIQDFKLTESGMKKATSGRPVNIDWLNLSLAIVNIATTFVTVINMI